MLPFFAGRMLLCVWCASPFLTSVHISVCLEGVWSWPRFLGKQPCSKSVWEFVCVCVWTSAPRWLCFPSSTRPTLVLGAGLPRYSAAVRLQKREEDTQSEEEILFYILQYPFPVKCFKVPVLWSHLFLFFPVSFYSFAPLFWPVASVLLPPGCRCWICRHMFCVYHPLLSTSLANSHTVNIYMVGATRSGTRAETLTLHSRWDR